MSRRSETVMKTFYNEMEKKLSQSILKDKPICEGLSQISAD